MSHGSPVYPGTCTTTEFDVVHAPLLRFFPDLVKELGGNLDLLLKKAEVDAEFLHENKLTANYRQACRLLELAASELKCPDIGMRLAKLQIGKVYTPLALVMKNSRTFGDALDYASKHYFAHSLAARIRLNQVDRDNLIFISHDLLLDQLQNRIQVVEQLLLFGHLLAMEFTGGWARVRRVHFRHQPVAPLKVYRRHFGCEVRFDQREDGIAFSEQDLACPIIDPESHVYQAMTSFIDTEFTQHKPPLHVLIRGLVMQFFGTELCGNERLAAELNMHPRTLLRRLKEEGTSFQQIKDEVCRDVMLYYLQQTDLEFGQISERLGFAEQSVMTRKCNLWFSASPTKVRAQRREKGN